MSKIMNSSEEIECLSPLLEIFLNEDQLKQICKNLEKKHILKCDMKKNDGGIARLLVRALSLLPAENWAHLFAQEISKLGEQQLASVVLEYLTKSNHPLSWIVSHWEVLTKSPNTFDDLDWLLFDGNETKCELLWKMALNCMDPENFSNTYRFVIQKMTENIQPAPKTSERSYTNAKDLRKLFNLQTLLSCELAAQHILDLTKKLYSKNIISTDILETVKELLTSKETNCESETIALVLNSVKESHIHDWETLFLSCLSDSAGILVSHFCDACFKHPESVIFQWIAFVWKDIKARPKPVCLAYEQAFQSFITYDDEWLLQITHSLLSKSKDNIHTFARMLVHILQQKITETEAMDDSNDLFVNMMDMGSLASFGKLPQATSAHFYDSLWFKHQFSRFIQFVQGSKAPKIKLDLFQEPPHSHQSVPMETDARIDVDDKSYDDPTGGSGRCLSGENPNKPKQSIGSGCSSRSKDNDIKFCNDLICMATYNCDSTTSEPCPTSEEKVVEMRLVIDGTYTENKDQFGLFVYVDNLKTKLRMHKDSSRDDCFHTFVCIPKTTEELQYKYMRKTYESEKWEIVPQESKDAINRKRQIKNSDVSIFFDVCNFIMEHINMDQFTSMYARNIKKHLPDPKKVKLPASTNAMTSHMYYKHIYNWWLGAQCGNTELRSYVKALPEEFEGPLSVVVQLVVCSIVCKFKVDVRNDKEYWNKLCSGLNITRVSHRDYLNLTKHIDELFGDKKQAIDAALQVFEKNKSMPQCPMILPLVYILLNGGSSDHDPKVWETVKKISKFSTLTHELQKQGNCVCASPKLQSKIKKLAEHFQGLPRLYQEISSIKSSCKLLDKDPDFRQLFDAELFLDRISADHSRYENYKALSKSSVVSTWIYEKIKCKVSSVSDSNEHVDQLKKSIKLNFQKICLATEYKKDQIELLKWAFSLWFLFPRESKAIVEIVETIGAWFNKDPTNKISQEKLQFLCFLVEIKHDHEETAKLWKHQLEIMLTEKVFLEKLHKDFNYIIHFDEIANPNKVVTSCFLKAVETFLDEKPKSKERGRQLNSILSKSKSILPSLEKIFFNHWDKVDGNLIDKVLHILNHPIALLYLKLIAKTEIGSQKHLKVFGLFKKGLASAQNMFNVGSISSNNLELILQAKDEFLVALAMIKKESSVDERFECLTEMFDLRRCELEFVKKSQAAKQHLIDLCQSTFPGTFEDPQLNLSFGNSSWCDVIKCYVNGNDKPVSKPKITLLGLTDAQQQVIMEIFATKINKNSFIQMWWKTFYRAALAETENHKLSLDDIVSNVWKKMVEKFSPMKTLLIQGNMLLIDVERNFTNLDRDGVIHLYEALFQFPATSYNETPKTTEICAKIIDRKIQVDDSSNSEEINELRINQICNYFSMKQQQENIAAILKIKDILKLNGDFKCLDVMQNENISEDTKLGSISESALAAGKLLKSVTKTYCTLIDGFVTEHKLIDWIRVMKDRSEVKVMSDLAMISAGESVDDVDRVSCFLSAVMGFGPLLFDLHKDSSLEDVINSLHIVHEHYKRDEGLIKKWKATASTLEWLKRIKEFHGSVEQSSLLKVQDIISNGTYIIACDEKIPTVECAVKLCYAQTEDTEKNDMTLSDLQDLQSRLMLIEDKGLKDVKLFIQTLSVVENLAQAYVDLKQAGCLLFDHFRVTIQCKSHGDDERNMLAKVTFDEVSPAMICNENAVVELQNLTNVLKGALARWRKSLSDKRLEYYHLNHYNIQQISYLCHELSFASHNKDLPNQLFTLLSVIKSDINHEELLRCLGEASALNEVQNEDNVKEETVVHTNNEETSDKENRFQIVHKLRKDDVPVKVAKAGVQQAYKLDYDDIFIWCLENENEDDIIDEFCQQFEIQNGVMDITGSIGVIQLVVQDKTTLTLKKVIKKLQTDERGSNEPSICVNTIFTRYVDEHSKTSLTDCICLDHLGHFLKNISTLVDQSSIPNRMIPEALHQNVNLIICPEQDTFTILISLFMLSPKQPLPTVTEVLLCTDKTTENDVDLLLRRAVISSGTSGKRIYCLVHTEKLDFEVANSVQNTLHLLQKDCLTDFTLVILCSSNHHFIASLFHEQKVDYVNRYSIDDTKKYLQEKLRDSRGDHSVLLVTSNNAGLGKSLYISRIEQTLSDNWHKTTVRFLEKDCHPSQVLKTIRDSNAKNDDPHFVHLDITPSVQNGINDFLFNLIILGSFEDNHGILWRRHFSHMYCIEYTCLEGISVLDHLLLLLPTAQCLSPLQLLLNGYEEVQGIIGMDRAEFLSETFQRPYQYLKLYDQQSNLDKFCYEEPTGDPMDCLQTLHKHCGVQDPSWSLLRHFASFLSCQLRDCESSVFCDADLMGPDSGLSGFKNFVVKFMIRMSQDFATPSLVDADTKPKGDDHILNLHQVQMRRSWEQRQHPYIFFNDDRMSMTFLNFQINNRGDLLSSREKNVIEHGMMKDSLVKGLERQGVDLQCNFDGFPRKKKLSMLYQVFGNTEHVVDPDPTYELTTDNVLKMLAIHMRFRCDIPVIIMGETGCGKTRMVEFMSKLKANCANLKKNDEMDENEMVDNIKNMVIVKVHGGITVEHIQNKVIEAADLAEENRNKLIKVVEKKENIPETILFLDEANTTEAIYAIKEFVCDGSVCGKMISKSGLKIVAACNPYRRHTEEAVKKMENAGLGFKVKTDDTSDKLGEIPMRCLVYRVIALPPSMHPLVWDFGQLGERAERVYIEQMVHRNYKGGQLESHQPVMVDILSMSQAFMKRNRQECLFVSLRDVERCLVSFDWFYRNKNWLFPLFKHTTSTSLPHIVLCLIHAVGMCYHVTLSERTTYRELLSRCFTNYGNIVSELQILQELVSCQEVFLNAIELSDDIASNEALRENVFMIIMCCEMRIPLFLIGKPGSSKSLAKTIVTDAMQGSNSNNGVFQKLKQIHVLSFQCSPVTDAVGIESVFKQCKSLQKRQDCQKFVAVVVLDEIGLAEDSPKMPLKVLHPLLESGSTDSTLLVSTSSQQKDDNTLRNVGFVGISNWALDPAKMNRGLFVHRGAPTKEDLMLTAKGIFHSKGTEYKDVSKIVEAVTKSYLQIDEERRLRHTEKGNEQNIGDQEFFGLRDYYGLLKMIYAVFCDEETTPTYYNVFYAIMRNFSGGKFNCLSIFVQNFETIWPGQTIPEITLEKMIRDNLQQEDDDDTYFCESRYLLLMTNHLAAVNLLSRVTGKHDFEVVFGSSFPQDNNYTEKCRNINHIKMCMEEGNTVLLLNLKDLYESLYDALNQHYVTFAGQRYVDLGLGGHRVKCRVHSNFRLVVMEDMRIVYTEFPIPLINRLEKHIFTTKSLLSASQRTDTERLEQWVRWFSHITQPQYISTKLDFSNTDAFVGYMEDTAGSAVISVTDVKKPYETAQLLLLNTATCDGVLRLEKSQIRKETSKWQKKYFEHQHHDNLLNLLFSYTGSCTETGIVELDVTSFSQILSERDRQVLEESLHMQPRTVMLITLQQFKTVSEFIEKLNKFLMQLKQASRKSIQSFVLLIQCPQSHTPLNLIACAKHALRNALKDKFIHLKDCNAQLIVAFLYAIERQFQLKNQLKSFFSLKTTSVFVDEFRATADYIGPPSKIRNLSLGELFASGLEKQNFHTHDIGQRRVSNFVDPNFKIDLHYLLVHSLSLALTKLDFSSKEIYDERAKLLLSVFSSKDNICSAFVKRIAESIVDLAKKLDLQSLPRSWTSTIAFSSMALQEGGSYTKALWLYLKEITSTLLAYVISEIDEDHNLSTLWGPYLNNKDVNCPMQDVWLNLQHDKIVCDLSLNNTDKSQQFLVRGSLDYICQFPFSRKLITVFQKQWKLVHFQEGARMRFHNKISNMSLNVILKEAFQSCPEKMLKYFVHDMVCLKYKCATDQNVEIDLIMNIIMEVWKQKQTDYDKDVEISSNCAALVFVLLEQFTTGIKQVHSILKVFPQLLTTANSEAWIKEQVGHSTVIVQTVMLGHALEHIKQKSDNLETVEDYHGWADTIRELKPTADEVLLNPGTEMQQKMWKALAFGALFLEQLVPPGIDETLYEGYIKVLVPLSKRLWKGALKIGLNNDKYLNMLVKNLNGIVKKIRLMYLLDWNDSLCKQCKKMIVEPVVLPCSHALCYRCTHVFSLAPYCPTCRVRVPENFVPKLKTLSPQQSKDIEVLSANCTSFFLEYLSTLCFPAPGSDMINTDAKKSITSALHTLVIGENRTKEMAPLETTVFDHTPTVRSFILQLLLRCDRQEVKDELEFHFSAVSSILENKLELMIIYMQCVEDMLHQKINRSIFLLLQEQIEMLEKGHLTGQLQHLDLAAHLRFILHVVIDRIQDPIEINSDKFLEDTVNKLTKVDEVVLQYFVKLFCRRNGISLFSSLVEHEYLKNLVPKHLRTDVEQELANFLVVISETVETTKKCLNESVDNENIEEVCDELSNICHGQPSMMVMLDIISWAVFSRTSHDKKQKLKFAVSILENLHNTSKLMDNVYSVSEALLCQSQVWFGSKNHQLISELFVAAVITMATSNQPLVMQFYTLVTNHVSINNKFIPTMPQSSYFDVKAIVKTWLDPTYKKPPKEYLCPNGHLYFVGDCTNVAKVDAFCPECKAPIGGLREGVLKPGNQAGELTEASQAGYKLPLPKDRGYEAEPERNCNKLSVSVIRFLLHSNILLHCAETSIQRLLNVSGDNEARKLLLLHMEKDLLQFSNSMGRSLEDSALLFHQILKHISQSNFQGYFMNCNFTSMVERKLWEKEFQHYYLLPVFKTAEQKINEARNIVLQAKQQSDLERLVYEIPFKELKVDENVEDVVPWNDPSLWNYRVNITVNHLRQKLNGDIASDTDEGAVLQLILERPNLHILCHLEDIIETQIALVEKYRQRVDASDVESITVLDYLHESNSIISQMKFDVYLTLWNKYRCQFKSEIPSEYFDEDLTFESPISAFIPSKVGRGQCALLFTKFIVQQQNELIGRCRDMLKPTPKFEMVKITQLTSNDIIFIENKQKLLPYVLANSQYEATVSPSGSKHEIKYRIPALQKQILQRFIFHKKLIDVENMPCIEFLQDVGMVKEFEKLVENVRQEKLPIKTVHKLEGIKGTTTLPMTCEAVRTLTLVVKHLSKMKGDDTTDLVGYATKDLMLPAEETDLLPKSSKLCHTRALFEWFSWQRSLKYVLSGQNPFRNVVKPEDCEEMENTKIAMDCLKIIDVEQLQMEINSLLIMKTGLNMDAGLKYYLTEFAEERDIEAPWIDQLPEEICVKHAVHFFKLSAE